MIDFRCPRCKTNIQKHDHEAGSKLPCPGCGQRLQVPPAVQSPAPTAYPQASGHAVSQFSPIDLPHESEPDPLGWMASQPTGSRKVGANRGGYVQSNLLPGETVVYWAHLHWFIFVSPCFFMALGLLVFLVLVAGESKDAIFSGLLVGGSVSAFGFVLLVDRYINYISSEFAVTTKRVIMKSGFIRRNTLELLHNKIDALKVDQSILGRILDFGAVGVAVATEKQSFSFVSNPLEFRRQVQARQS